MCEDLAQPLRRGYVVVSGCYRLHGARSNILDTKDPGVQLETRNAKIVWNGELVEASPESGHSLQWQSRHDLNLPKMN